MIWLLTRRAKQIISIGLCSLVLAVAGGCGSDNILSPEAVQNNGLQLNGNNLAPTLSLSLTGVADGQDDSGQLQTKEVIDNVLTVDGVWRTWVNTESSVTVDASGNFLRIPASQPGQDVVHAVRHYARPLSPNVQYRLSVQSDNPQAAAIIFLQFPDSLLVPAALDATGGLALATPGNPVRFEVAAGVIGFFVQVQNGYRADTAALVNAALTGDIDFADSSGSPDNADGELIALSGSWHNWDDEPGGVSFDATSNRLRVLPPPPGRSFSLGIRRIRAPLDAGRSYLLQLLDNTDRNAALLLFLFDENGQLISTGGPTPWLSVVGREQLRFTAPAHVASIVAQVQSGANARQLASLTPSLRPATTDDEPLKVPGNMPTTDAPPPDPVAMDPTVPDTIQRDRFVAMLIGRRAFACQTLDDASFPSYQFVDTYTADLLVADIYFYRSDNCAGLPTGGLQPVNVRRYSVGEEIVTADGRSAWEIDFEVLVQGNSGGASTDRAVGSRTFDLVSVEQNNTIYAADPEATTESDRPRELAAGMPGPVQLLAPFGSADLSAADFAGTWTKECGSSPGESEQVVVTYTNSTMQEQVTAFADSSCQTALYTYQVDRDIMFDQVQTTVLNDYHLPFSSVVTRSEFIEAANANPATLPSLPAMGELRFGALSLLPGQVLVPSGCLDNRVQCGRNEANRPDTINLFSGRRLQRPAGNAAI